MGQGYFLNIARLKILDEGLNGTLNFVTEYERLREG